MKKIVFTLFILHLFSAHTYAVQLIGHRGDQTRHLENTLGAFKASWSPHTLGAEGDIMLSKDGEIVFHHDDDLKRLSPTKDPRKVRELSLGELREVPLRDPTRPQVTGSIPTFSEVLKAMPAQHKMIIELKGGDHNEGIDPKLISKFLKKIKGLENRVLVISFDFKGLAKIKKANTDLTVLGLTANKPYPGQWVFARQPQKKEKIHPGSVYGVAEAIALTKSLGLDGLYIELTPTKATDRQSGPSFDKTTLEKIKQAGLLSGIWSYGADDTFENFIQLKSALPYLDFYHTNFPNDPRLLKFLEGLKELTSFNPFSRRSLCPKKISAHTHS